MNILFKLKPEYNAVHAMLYHTDIFDIKSILFFIEETEIENKNFMDFVHPSDINKTLAQLENLKKGDEVINFTNRYLCKNGSCKYIEWRSYPIGNKISY